VADVRKLDEPGTGNRARELATVFGQRAVVAAADHDERRQSDVTESFAEALGRRDRAALPNVVHGVVLEQPRAVLVQNRGIAAERQLGERRILRPEVLDPAFEPDALDPLRRGEHPRGEIGQVGLRAEQDERADVVRPVEGVLERDARAERVADEHRPLELEPADDLAEVVSPARKRELRALELARASRSAQIDEDEAVPRIEALAHAVPERPRQAEAVHEHDRQALARHFDVQLRAVDRERSHPARLSTASTIP
jgi:hypothetical protein